MKNKESYIYHHPCGFDVSLTSFLNYCHATDYYKFSPTVINNKEKHPICNGAGPAGYGAIVPDKIWGLSITETANGHDWNYQFGETLEDKEQADRTFRDNMDRIIRMAFMISIQKAEKSNIILRPLLIKKARTLYNLRLSCADKIYYKAVQIGGKSAFWDKGICDFTWDNISPIDTNQMILPIVCA
ncbi:hypothetical protein HY745_02855 [Candidatus Desantisbacteria bacterium]|nr:hypothetical protein [Candidatus Desantisbacteria bacterium]